MTVFAILALVFFGISIWLRGRTYAEIWTGVGFWIAGVACVILLAVTS